MTKKIRTILFFIFGSLFLLTTPTVILYSQGYRINFNTAEGWINISRTGGLFLKALPKQAEIYIDEKLTKKTDFFFGSALIENLLPKTYKIRVLKEGFFSWEKNLEIKEKEVIEAKNIILFPKDIKTELILKNIQNFWLPLNGKDLILLENEKNGWALKLYDLEKNLKSHLVSERNVSESGATFLDLTYSENPTEIILKLGILEEVRYFSLNFEKIPPILKEIESPSNAAGNHLAEKKIDNTLFYLDESGNLFKNGEKLTKKPFPVKQETEYDLEVFSDFIFLKEEKTLYLFSQGEKTFEKLFENLNNFRISPDSKKLVFSSDNEIWLFFLADDENQPKRKAGERVFLMRLSEKIGDCFWLNNDYLIFNSGPKIKISEIDNRDKINIYEFGEFKDPKIFFEEKDKKLYILSEGNLSSLENLF